MSLSVRVLSRCSKFETCMLRAGAFLFGRMGLVLYNKFYD